MAGNLTQSPQSVSLPRRRKGPDLWVRAIQWVAGVAWSLFIAFLLFLGLAKPEGQTFFDKYYNIQRSGRWNTNLLDLCFYLLVGTFLICLAGLIINSRRCRRKTDRYNRSLVVIGLLSLLGIIGFLVLG